MEKPQLILAFKYRRQPLLSLRLWHSSLCISLLKTSSKVALLLLGCRIFFLRQWSGARESKKQRESTGRVYGPPKKTRSLEIISLDMAMVAGAQSPPILVYTYMLHSSYIWLSSMAYYYSASCIYYHT